MELYKELPEPVQWSEGMLLSPHHFQQNHIYWEAQMQHQMGWMQPNFWGLIDLEIDNQSALAGGMVIIKSLKAIMPDGLIVKYSDTSGYDLRIDLNDYVNSAEAITFRLYLAVPVRTECAASSSSRIQRFISVKDKKQSVDENTGETTMIVSRLRPVLSLHTGEKPGPGYISMPLLKISKSNNDERFRISEYLPPILNADALAFSDETHIGKRLRSFVAMIRKKSYKLLVAVENDNNGEFSSGEYYLSIIRRLVAELPKMEILINSGQTHPFDLYLGMAGLLGEICAINDNPIPAASLPGYNHDDMWPGFKQIIDYVSSLLNKITFQYSVVLLDEPKPGFFNIMLDEKTEGETVLLELIGAKNQSPIQLKEWVDYCRIASSNKLQYLKEHRDSGAVRTVTKNDNTLNVKAGAGNILVRIPIDNEMVCCGKKLCLLSTTAKQNELKPEAIRLFIPIKEATDND